MTDGPEESAAELRVQLRFLRMQRRTASIEDRAAIDRKIAELEEQLR